MPVSRCALVVTVLYWDGTRVECRHCDDSSLRIWWYREELTVLLLLQSTTSFLEKVLYIESKYIWTNVQGHSLVGPTTAVLSIDVMRGWLIREGKRRRSPYVIQDSFFGIRYRIHAKKTTNDYGMVITRRGMKYCWQPWLEICVAPRAAFPWNFVFNGHRNEREHDIAHVIYFMTHFSLLYRNSRSISDVCSWSGICW